VVGGREVFTVREVSSGEVREEGGKKQTDQEEGKELDCIAHLHPKRRRAFRKGLKKGEVGRRAGTLSQLKTKKEVGEKGGTPTTGRKKNHRGGAPSTRCGRQYGRNRCGGLREFQGGGV